MVNTAGMDELPYGNSSMPAVFTIDTPFHNSTHI